MDSQPFSEIGGDAYVAVLWNSETLEKIDVLHEAVPLRTSARHASRDSRPSTAGLSAVALAKADGGRAIQPSLIPILRFNIRGVALAA